MSETSQAYDLIVIGTGQGGKPLATAFARAGRRAAIIEEAAIGGTCVNTGCTPSKAMIAGARAAWMARRADRYGVHAAPVRVDMEEVRARKRRIVEISSSGNRKGLEGTENLDLVEGHARFTGPQSVQVELHGGGTLPLEGEVIIINTGLQPAIPPLEGLEEVAWLDSTSIMELDRVPDHLLVLGGGYIGLEFGQMMRRYGAEVTIVQRASQLLPREDEDVATLLAQVLQDEGIEVLLDSEATKVEENGDGLKLTVSSPGGSRTLSGSHLLVAVGRSPNTGELGLDAAGVETGPRGEVLTSDRFETSVDGVYAIGDVRGGPAFTHISYDDHRILAANLLEGAERSTEGRLVPYTVFTDPQLGHVGLHQWEAQERGLEVDVATMPMKHVAYAWERGEERGMVKAVVDRDEGRILGFTALGVEGGDFMSQVQIAMLGGLGWRDLRDATFTHPSLAEALNNLWGSLEG